MTPSKEERSKMTMIDTPAKSATPVELEQILTCAVILHWEALTMSSTADRVKVEYHIASDGSVEYLKLWMSARGYWSLICDYSVHPAWSDGPRFSNGYHSRTLGRLLQSIVMNQGLFRHGCGPNSNGLLEVSTPTEEQISEARLRVDETFQRAS